MFPTLPSSALLLLGTLITFHDRTNAGPLNATTTTFIETPNPPQNAIYYTTSSTGSCGSCGAAVSINHSVNTYLKDNSLSDYLSASSAQLQHAVTDALEYNQPAVLGNVRISTSILPAAVHVAGRAQAKPQHAAPGLAPIL
ncbi:hypothetical protein PENANT_c010G01608 [Penicillium antarcticum]|uniref:Uncharacterized protein n=1 Tax=Penicillium antarcticum TaxID=416450 RepID=A0A1V6Q7K3_9EURO|nr:hypothetical protein PENANT_c010G01608 [Penicillium antarcticum]